MNESADEQAGDPNSWEERNRRAREALIPWIEQTVPLAGKTVLEYGCGNAAVSCAFAERAARLIGVDIDRHWIDRGTQEVRRRGLANVELELHTLDSILDAVATHAGEVDVFLLYAVLEHLTVSERLAVLRLAREVVRPEGAIVVCEAPNRLIYMDHHTAQMPFFHLLPDELAAEYYPRSARRDFRAALDAAARNGRDATIEAIVRWGRGISFHEFEVVFGDLTRHLIASNYDPLLFEERPVHPDELILARYLERWCPDLAPVWSRYWLDLILAPWPVETRAPFLRPWTFDTAESENVGFSQDDGLHLSGLDSRLVVSLRRPTGRLVIGTWSRSAERLALRAEADSWPIPFSFDASDEPGRTRYVSLSLPLPAQRIVLTPSHQCQIVFVGYQD